jgi:hypothetical protein
MWYFDTCILQICSLRLNYPSPQTFIINFFFSFGNTGVWTQGLVLTRQALYHLNHFTSPFLCWVFRISQTICQVWLWTTILLISSSWVTKIIGVCHQCADTFIIYSWWKHSKFFILDFWNIQQLLLTIIILLCSRTSGFLLLYNIT